MADKANLQVSIEAVDNFSSVLDKLDKKLSDLSKNQFKVHPSTMKSINNQIESLRSGLEGLNSGKLSTMPKDAVNSALKGYINQIKDLSNKVDNALKKLNYQNKIGLSDKTPDLSKYKENIVKSVGKSPVIKAKVVIDDSSIEQATKSAQKILDGKPLKQKVKLVTEGETKNKDSSTKKKSTVKKAKPEEIVNNIKREVENKGVSIKPVTDEKAARRVGKEIAKLIQQEVSVVNLSNIKSKLKASIDDKYLRQSMLDTISKLSEKTFRIKIGKDEKFFDRNIKENIKSVNNKKLSINITPKMDYKNISNLSSIKNDMINSISKITENLKLGINPTINNKSLSKSISESVSSIGNKPFTIKIGKDEKFFINNIKENIKRINELKLVIKLGADINTKGLLNKLKEATNSAKEAPSIKIQLSASSKGLLASINEAIKGIGSLPVIKLALQATNKGLKSSIKEAIKDAGDISIPTKTTQKSASGGSIGSVKEQKDAFKTLLQQRNAALVAMDKAYQNYGKNNPNYYSARKDFFDAQNLLTQFQRDSGISTAQANINDLKKQLQVYANSSPIRKELQKQLGKAYIDQENEKQRNDIKYKDKLTDNQAKFEQKYNQELNKAQNAFIQQVYKLAQDLDKARTAVIAAERKASEQARSAVFKEGYASDAHNTKLLEYQRKAEAKNIAEQAKKEVEQQKLLNDYLKAQKQLEEAKLKKMRDEEVAAQKLVNLYQKQLELQAKQSAGWNRVERQRDKINKNKDIQETRKSLQQQADTLKIKTQIDDKELKQFMKDLEKLREMTNSTSLRFYQNMAKSLGIANDTKLASAMRNQQQELQRQYQNTWWNNTGQPQNNTQNAKQVRSTYQTMAAEARKYAQQAEMAWRNAGNQSSADFEKYKKNFQRQMEKMVEFRRSLGNLSYGAEVNIFSNMARSINKTNPLYDKLIDRVRQLKKEQRELNDSMKEPSIRRTTSGNQVPWGTWAGALAYVTRFVGRSAKGSGSALEAQAQVITDASKATGLFAAGLTKVMVAFAAITAGIGLANFAITTVTNALQTFGNLLIKVGTMIYNALKPGIELYKQQQGSIFSFTAAIQSVGALPDGTRLSSMGSEGRNIARGISTQLIEQATFDAEITALNLGEILEALQGVMPMLMQLGMSVEQAYEITKGVAGVAKFTRLAPHQVLQETRDLAQGSITTRNSQVANTLGITNEDLEQFKGNAEDLYKFLMEKFKNYNDLLNEFEDTALGRWQQLQERWANVTKNIVDGIAPQFKGLFETIIEATGRWEDKNKNYFDAIRGEWRTSSGEFIATIDDIKQKIDSGLSFKEAYESFGIDIDSKKFILSEGFDKVRDALVEIVEYTAQTLDYLIQWAKETAGTEDLVDTIKVIIEKIISLFAATIIIIGDIIAGCYEWKDVIISLLKLLVDSTFILSGIILSIKVIVDEALLVLDVFFGWITSLTNVKRMISYIADALGKIKAGDFSGAFSSLEQAGTEASETIDNWKKRIASDWKTLGSDFNATGKLIYEGISGEAAEDIINKFNSGLKANGKLYYSVNRNNGKKIDKGDSNGYGAKDIKGIPRDKEDDKARKQAIKDSQKALKEHLKGLKEALQDHIDRLKEIQKERDIAYEEGFTSIKDYFTQKAELEAEEARLRLEEAQEELAALKEAQFENEYDRLKELHSVEREISKYSRAVEKTTRQQNEVARNINRATYAQNKLYNMYSTLLRQGNFLQTQVSTGTGGVVGSGTVGSVSGLKYKMTKDVPVNLEGLKDVAVDITRMVKEMHGIDLDVGHLYGLFVAEVGSSGVSDNWEENRNPGGFTAWEGTPDNLVDWEHGRGPGESGHYERYIDTTYEDFIKYLAKEWFQPGSYRVDALMKGVSADDMYNILYSHGYHTSYEPSRRDTYAEGESYSDLYARASQPISTSQTNVANATGKEIVDDIGNKIAYGAYEYVRDGVPYAWGGTSKSGVDCSGLVYSIYRSLGIDIERQADEQAKQMKNKGGFYEDAAKLMVGDLVFMRGSYPGENGVGHVGIYTGEGKIAHASTSSQPVKYSNLSDRNDIVGYGSVRVLTGQFKNLSEQLGQAVSEVPNFTEVVQKASSLIDGAINILADESGNIIGYTPTEEYSRGGLDTRYMTFQDMSGGADAQISGLKEEVKQSINLIAKEFFEKTGEKIEWSSFTGSSLHSTSEWGHYYGWKADANINDSLYSTLKEILTKYGVAAGVESVGTDNQHVDMSWAKGQVGGPDRGGYYLTKYVTGEDFYNKSRNATTKLEVSTARLYDTVNTFIEDKTQNIDDALNNIKSIAESVGIYDLDIPNTTDLGHKSLQEYKSANLALADLVAENTSHILGNTQGTLLKLIIELSNDLSKHKSGSAEDKDYIHARIDKFNNDAAKAITEGYETKLEYNLRAIERNSKFRETDIYTGKESLESITNKYHSYFTDENNPNGIAGILKQMEDKVVFYTNKGFLNEAMELRDKIENAKNSLFEMFSSWIETGQKYWENAEAIFNASDKFTPTQREFAEREFKAYRSQREYNDRVQIGNKLAIDYNNNLKQIKELSKTSEDYAKNLEKINLLSDNNKRIEAYALENEQLKKLAEQSSKMPDLLDDIKKAARDALDNGLVEFLTDGITEAESLKDALKDLATSILKEIQKVSAKWIVKDLMNWLFGTFNVEENIPTDPNLRIINDTLVNGFNSVVNAINQLGGINNQDFLNGDYNIMDGVRKFPNPREDWLNNSGSVGLGAFSQPWNQSPLNPNAKVSTTQQYGLGVFSQPWNQSALNPSANVESESGLSEFSKNLIDVNAQLQTTSTTSLPDFTDSLGSVTDNISESISSGTLDTATQQLSTSIQTGGLQIEAAFTQIITILNMIVTQLQTLSSQLSSISFNVPTGTPSAEGAYTGALVKNNRILKLAKGGAVYNNNGLINGPGSETSDSIPAMLSNGEAVLNAKAVRRLGVNFISAVNNGNFTKIKANIPHFADGGIIGNAYQSTARGMTDFANNIGTNVSTTNHMNVALVRDEREAMEHFMKSPRGQRILVDFQKGNGRVFSRFSNV